MPAAPIPDHEAARIAALKRYRLLDTLPEQGYDDIAALATFICGTPVSLISFVGEGRQWFKSKVGIEGSETGREESFCAFTLDGAKTLIVEDTLLDERFRDNPLVLGDPGIRFYAGAPLVDPAGFVLGTVCVIDTQPRVLTATQVSALEALSRQVMLLLESRLVLIENEKATKALLQSEKLAAVGRLASSMAHEINNPLEAITNLLYLARDRAEVQEVKEWLDQADQELRRISVLANQTLRFHRQATRPRPMTCLSLFSIVLDVYEARLKNFSIEVEKRKRAHEAVQCFEGDIRQVLSNVITNAIDAMPLGGRLILRSREATDFPTGRRGVVLTIADTGTGMDAETRSRLFEAFFSTKGIGGSGLGLWISADIMKRHEGWIRIRSSQRTGNRGTVVQLFLPCVLSDGGRGPGAIEDAAVPSTV